MEAKKIRRTMFTALGVAVMLCFAQGTAAQVVPHLNDYLILRSGELFTVTKEHFVIGPLNQPLQSAIDAIRADAAQGDCFIQFGNGITPLDIGDEYISFDNVSGLDGGVWGTITLDGKITSASTAVIVMHSFVSINSRADITNNAPGGPNPQNYGIMLNSIATLTISGGSVSSPFGSAIYNDGSGSVIIRGGSVSTESGSAILHSSTGALTISGGTVSATTGRAVGVTNSAGSVTISGGRVLAGSGYAVFKSTMPAVNLTGNGVVFAYGTGTGDVIYGDYTLNGASMVIAWNKAAGNTTYTQLSNTDLFMETALYPPIGTGPMAVWNVPNRIAYRPHFVGGIAGEAPPPPFNFIEIEGVTVVPGENHHTVTFDSQGGSAVTPQIVSSGGNAAKPADPTRTDYTFAGWYKDVTCSMISSVCSYDNLWDFNNDNVTEDITLYAKWTSGTSALASPLVNVNSLSPVISVRGKTLNVRIPASLQSSQTLQIRMIDMRGRTAADFNITNNTENSLTLTKIPAGRYIVEVKNAGKRVSSTPVMVR
ncbi:MAG: InlB B-repeat-containing protein [Chitinispirillia bacterium]|nr:InlB B-repeat-containing protein [Chitinispirillia bacterium]